MGADHVGLLTWSFFQRRFAGDASMIGKQIRLNSTPYEVIGVLPRWFTYPDCRVRWGALCSLFSRRTMSVTTCIRAMWSRGSGRG